MSITYSVKLGGTFIHTVAKGAVSVEELLGYQQALGEDERIKHGAVTCELFDASLAVASEDTQGALELMAERLKENPEAFGSGRVAIVIGGGAEYKMARLYEDLVADIENVIVFNDVSTALIWLGIEPEVLEED